MSRPDSRGVDDNVRAFIFHTFAQPQAEEVKASMDSV